MIEEEIALAIDNREEIPGLQVYASNSRILVIDDEPFNLQSMKIVLSLSMQKLEYDQEIIQSIVDYVSSGEEAL